MASETRPGVIVVQELSETPAAVSAPTLLPVAVGPCFQIVEALESDGSLNADAKYGDEQYNQAALAIPQADLPDPRSNIPPPGLSAEFSIRSHSVKIKLLSLLQNMPLPLPKA